MRARASARAPVTPSDVHQFSQRPAGSSSWQIAWSAPHSALGYDSPLGYRKRQRTMVTP
jgi:hypothetical protein